MKLRHCELEFIDEGDSHWLKLTGGDHNTFRRIQAPTSELRTFTRHKLTQLQCQITGPGVC